MREVLSDVLIIGGGPAGLTAAIYAKRAGLSVALLEQAPLPGGQMATTPEIENYPGTGTVDGFALSQAMAGQAQALGVKPVVGGVTALDIHGDSFTAHTANQSFIARTVILAMGARRRRLNLPGEDALAGRGISWCAVCDGFFYKEQAVAVIGGGNTALEDALHLVGLGCHVTLIHRRTEFRAGAALIERVMQQERIQIRTPYIPEEFQGRPGGEISIGLRHALTNAQDTWTGAGVFECVGTVANTELLAGRLPLDDQGRIQAGEDTLTPIPGLFAAGDIRRKPLYQIVTAAADGAAAATAAADYCGKRQKDGNPPKGN